MHWHHRVKRRSILKQIESYIVDRKHILSSVSFIDAAKDAQRCIIEIRNFILNDTRDFTLNGFLQTNYQSEMKSIVRFSFFLTKPSSTEFELFFQLISNLVITRFTALLAISRATVWTKEMKASGETDMGATRGYEWTENETTTTYTILTPIQVADFPTLGRR